MITLLKCPWFAPLALLGLFSGAAQAGDVNQTGRYSLAPVARLSTTRPTVDGIVDKLEWYGATLLPRLIGETDGSVAQLRSRIRIAYDDANLYVAFQIDRPPNSLQPDASDTVSLLLDPAHEHK